MMITYFFECISDDAIVSLSVFSLHICRSVFIDFQREGNRSALYNYNWHLTHGGFLNLNLIILDEKLVSSVTVATFRYSVPTCGSWLLYWTAQIYNIFILAESSIEQCSAECAHVGYRPPTCTPVLHPVTFV